MTDVLELNVLPLRLDRKAVRRDCRFQQRLRRVESATEVEEEYAALGQQRRDGGDKGRTRWDSARGCS